MQRPGNQWYPIILSVATAPHGEIEARGSRIFCDGQKLTKEKAAALFSDCGGVDRSDQYLRNRKGYKTGVGLAVGGASLVVLGGSAVCVSSAGVSADNDAVLTDYTNNLKIDSTTGGIYPLRQLRRARCGELDP